MRADTAIVVAEFGSGPGGLEQELLRQVAHEVRPPVVEANDVGQHGSAIAAVVGCSGVGGPQDNHGQGGGHDGPVAEGGAACAAPSANSSHGLDHARSISRNWADTP